MVTTNAPIITLRDVRFTYDGGATWALDGVSLDIRRGERICLAGPNGSGKSTLSRVIAGLVAPDEGYVVLSGNVVFDECGAHADEYRTARCGIGAVFQHPEDQIVTTVTEDDVAFGPENLAIEHDEIGLRISGSLDAVDMSDYRASASDAHERRPTTTHRHRRHAGDGFRCARARRADRHARPARARRHHAGAGRTPGPRHHHHSRHAP